MREWGEFTSISNAKGVWLTDSKGHKMIDAVASMWCNVWGHSNKELVQAITEQSRKIQHTSMFNLTNKPAEELAKTLVELSPGMHRAFYSDNGSSAMEIALKMALQYQKNIRDKKRTKIAALKNGYHGDTFGSMSVGYTPEFFGRFKEQLFSTVQFPVPHRYKMPKGYDTSDYENHCLDKMETRFARDDIAALVMESGAQVAAGAIIYPKGFQRKVGKLCKKFGVLFVLDEIATGFGRLGSMIQYTEQGNRPDVVAYGKMLTGGYMTMAATLASKKIYDSFLGDFKEHKHLFHGHTYTGNPLATAVAYKNLQMYKKYNLIKKIQKTAKIFYEFYDKISEIDIVGDIRHKGMLMGIELVCNREKKTPIAPARSVNRIIFEEGRKNGIYLRTLGNIVMLVPPLAISESELRMLLERTIATIKSARPKVI